MMNAIPKRIHYDKDGRPEEVVLRYEDWVRLGQAVPAAPASFEEFQELAKPVIGQLPFGDGLEYQLRLRAEWDER